MASLRDLYQRMTGQPVNTSEERVGGYHTADTSLDLPDHHWWIVARRNYVYQDESRIRATVHHHQTRLRMFHQYREQRRIEWQYMTTEQRQKWLT